MCPPTLNIQSDDFTMKYARYKRLGWQSGVRERVSIALSAFEGSTSLVSTEVACGGRDGEGEQFK